ncbi:MAG TPA: hypothetical protein VMV92_39840 [Streptosporangiaceae bacterium]|nr:hypothetical protein [Streptosporangiaceae bacterium]
MTRPPDTSTSRPGSGTANAPELTLEDVHQEFPRWHCFHSIGGLVYARLVNASPPVLVRGEDPVDLRDEIRRWEGTH